MSFIVLLMITLPNGSPMYAYEPIYADSKAQCVQAGKKYADAKTRHLVSTGTATDVSFITCHDGSMFTSERPDVRD